MQLDVYCASCLTLCWNETATSKKNKIYKYKMCPKCKKRVNQDKLDKLLDKLIDSTNYNTTIFYDFKENRIINNYTKANNLINRFTK